MRATTIALLLSLGFVSAAHAGERPFVRTWDGEGVPIDLAAPGAAVSAAAQVAAPAGFVDLSRDCLEPVSFRNTVLARYGDNVPGVGPLYLVAPAGTANMNNAGKAAFWSRISAGDRNHGVFIADDSGIRAVVVGCGGGFGSGQPGTGCGDPSPIGGTFSGIYGGSGTPGFNDAGDVLFVSDVNGGSAPRGMFLYRAATQTFVKVVAIGDASPAGGTISSLGLASLNTQGDVVLIAEHNGAGGPVHVLKWVNGTLSTFLKVGDPAPGGGTFTLIGREYFGFQDGTRLYIGNVPGVNDAGQVAFFSLVSGGLAERGIFLKTGTNIEWYLKAGESSPAGGTYLDFWQPLLNESGQIAIFCDLRDGPGSAWIVGKPGQFRKALAFYDQYFGGQVMGMAVSRNPFQALDDCGNLVAWCVIRLPDTTEWDHTIFCRADGGTPLAIAKEGEATPIGGNYTGMSGWPSMANKLTGSFGAYTPGSGVPNAFFKFRGRGRGDLNCDGVVDFDDINPFVLALSDPGGYAAQYPDCDIRTGDVNGDGNVNFDDINPFVALLTS
ncbi:MAG: hypothetical protein AB1716_17300 [Planctomycetota bacterium]